MTEEFAVADFLAVVLFAAVEVKIAVDFGVVDVMDVEVAGDEFVVHVADFVDFVDVGYENSTIDQVHPIVLPL
jgi:hypothetical protein